MLQRPVTSGRRLREAPKLPSSRRTSPLVLAGTDGDRTRVTLAQEQVAAAVRQSAAESRRTASPATDRVRINWIESGGAPVAPTHEGAFGMTLLENVLGSYQGAVEIEGVAVGA